MKKRLLATILTSVLVVGSLAGCGNSTKTETKESTKTDGKKTITVWAWDTNYNIPIIKEAGKRYTEKHPDVEIVVNEYTNEDVSKKLQTAFASSTTKGLPDITLMEDVKVQKYLSTYTDQFVDLTSSLPFDKFADFKVKAVSYQDKKYGLPFDTGVAALFYRKDLLEKAGFTAKDLENITWDQYIEIGKKVKAATGVDWLVNDLYNGTTLENIMIQSAGQWYYDDNGKINIKDNKALEESLTLIKKMNDEKIFLAANDWTEYVSAYSSGKAATAIQGCWFLPTIKSDASASGKWAVTSVPRLTKTPNAKNASNQGGSSLYVLNSSENKDASIDFLKEVFAGDADFYQKILKDQGALCAYLPAFEGSAFETKDEYFGGQQIFKNFAQYIKDVPQVTYDKNTATAQNSVQAAIKDILDGNVEVSKVLGTIEEMTKNQTGE
ncbi:ABC transporter substrate-binding protein [Clostridium cellulovorans]|uniref:Extracellular solute-binding protein family 1 n=1 Tax=Clostridium cellulovorans (strain ATCC 35296 / DSM 3052 / OCM 3 / 743B) TaxID=573061 RepID=D9SLU2_CLOC7|nr:sugar ABC transporter substrate-binding protein [Clostridium cellulovorans]ADL53729.1 extracellular solute-binding protein family 1 [Clostridium cellulovorans 743B]